MTERTMPPCGPERDAAIAVDVMGWTRLMRGPIRPVQIKKADYSQCLYEPCWHRKGHSGHYFGPSDYSTDNHAALDVLMEIARRGWSYHIYYSPERGHRVSVWLPDMYLPPTYSPYLPDAITDAALRATWAQQDAEKPQEGEG